VWLEKKIDDVRLSAVNTPLTIKPGVTTIDSLSTISNFPNHASSPSSNNAIQGEPVKQSIVCRDVQVPPGKLNVIINSANDGPAIYSVNEGSALVNKLFPGDLITALDGVAMRNLSAEKVLHMMVEKNDVEQKITVLHCE
jgi:PDZ domain-containing secreted protein